MAIRKNGALSGKVGDLVCYRLNGQEVVRSLPDEVRQTKATKASAVDFGNIKRLSSRLRRVLMSVLPTAKSMPVMLAMDAAVRRWFYEFYLRRDKAVMDPAYFSSLVLKPETTPFVRTLLGVEPRVEWSEKKVTLHIPAMKKEDLLLHGSAKAISFTLLVSGTTVSSKPPSENNSRKFSQPVERELGASEIEPVTIEIDNYPMPNDSLFLAFLSVRYKSGRQWFDDEKWKPVLVVGSWFKEGEKLRMQSEEPTSGSDIIE